MSRPSLSSVLVREGLGSRQHLPVRRLITQENSATYIMASSVWWLSRRDTWPPPGLASQRQLPFLPVEDGSSHVEKLCQAAVWSERSWNLENRSSLLPVPAELSDACIPSPSWAQPHETLNYDQQKNCPAEPVNRRPWARTKRRWSFCHWVLMWIVTQHQITEVLRKLPMTEQG